jgi:hypothetical protein
MWRLNYMVATYLPCKMVILYILPGMTIRKNHPHGLKRWNGKFSNVGILGRKLLNHYCLPLHDHFGALLVDLPIQQNHEYGLCHVKTTQS